MQRIANLRGFIKHWEKFKNKKVRLRFGQVLEQISKE